MRANVRLPRKEGIKMVRNWNPIVEKIHHYNFQAGEPVTLLYQGRYDGMDGRYLGLTRDPNWAEVEDGAGVVTSHPLLWLRPSNRAVSAINRP